MVKICLDFSVARSENSNVAHTSDNIQKGLVRQVMIMKFLKALGVLAERTVAEIKIGRTTNIRQT